MVDFSGFNWYGVFFASGILIALAISLVRSKRRGIDLLHVEIGFFVFAIFALFGARLASLIFSGQLVDVGGFIAFWQLFFGINTGGIQGFSILGAVIVGVPIIIGGIWWSSWKTGVSVFTYFEAIIPALVVGQAVGRLGNYFNQEIFLNIPFDIASVSNFFRVIAQFFHLPGTRNTGFLQPLFLFEALSNLSLFFFVVFVFPKIKGYRIGMGAAITGIWWGAFRAITENFRNSSDILGGSFSFVSAIVIVVLSLIAFIWITVWHYAILPKRDKPQVAHVGHISSKATGLIDADVNATIIGIDPQKLPVDKNEPIPEESLLKAESLNNPETVVDEHYDSKKENKKLADEILGEIDYFIKDDHSKKKK